MSNGTTHPEAAAPDAGEGPVYSETPEGSSYKEHIVLVPASKLRDVLSQFEPAEDVAPLTAEQFKNVLARVDSLGWTWTTDDPPALIPKPGGQDEPEYPSDLIREYPNFPGELAAVIKFELFGWRPRAKRAGSPEDLAAKAEAISNSILTEEYRSAFFFDHATKGPRFRDLDWEVMVKTAERNVKPQPLTVYALVSLETADRQSVLEERLDTLRFAADEKSLQHMINLLQDALKAVQETQRPPSAESAQPAVSP